jgi:hypothetical protein
MYVCGALLTLSVTLLWWGRACLGLRECTRRTQRLSGKAGFCFYLFVVFNELPPFRKKKMVSFDKYNIVLVLRNASKFFKIPQNVSPPLT